MPLQILLGGDGGGVRFAQGITVILIGVGGRFHLEAQVFLPGFCLLSAIIVHLFDCRRFGDNGRILVRSFGSTIGIYRERNAAYIQ